MYSSQSHTPYVFVRCRGFAHPLPTPPPTPSRCRAPPPLTNPPIPRWEDLPPCHREELLRILGRMLTGQIDQAANVQEASHEPL